jgi:Mrp family chromosome partitioning ATPase
VLSLMLGTSLLADARRACELLDSLGAAVLGVVANGTGQEGANGYGLRSMHSSTGSNSTRDPAQSIGTIAGSAL